jgi:hypothetical protein
MTKIFTTSLSCKLASWTLVELRIERRNVVHRDHAPRRIVCRPCPAIETGITTVPG